MSESASSIRIGANAGLAAAIVLLVIGGGALLLGPGSGLLERLEGDLHERMQKLDGWTRERAGFRNASEHERAAWKSRWQELGRRVRPVADDPALVARVAQELSAPSVRSLEVEPQPRTAGDGDEESRGLLFASPVGPGRMVIEPVPLKVSFRSSYSDAFAILERLESGLLPARIEALDIKRDRPGVWLRMDLTYFVRARDDGAGGES